MALCMEKESTCGRMGLRTRYSICYPFCCHAIIHLGYSYAQGDFTNGSVTGTGSYFWPDGRYSTMKVLYSINLQFLFLYAAGIEGKC